VVDTNFFAFDSTLSDGTFYWRVKTLTVANTDSSEYSQTRRFDIDESAPQQPMLLMPPNGAQTGDSTPFFDWSTVSKAASPVTYDLEISTDPAFTPGPETIVYGGLTLSEYQPTVALTPDTTSYWRVIATDAAANSTTSPTFTVAYRQFICGDINFDGSLDVSDLTYLVNYAFRSGSPPPLQISSDVDASGDINIADVTRWVDFSFKSGPPLSCP
jgi:hypothetical protein